MTINNQRRLATGILAAIIMSSSLPVLAEPVFSTTKISVNASDIDLSTAAGAQTLQQRINSTIRTACAPVEFGGAPTYGSRDQARAVDECVASAHAATEPQFRKLIANGNPRMASN